MVEEVIMIRMCTVLAVILWTGFFLIGAEAEVGALYKKAVAVEYKNGMKAALPYYKELIDKYPDSGRATQAMEKIIRYRKEIEKKQHKAEGEAVQKRGDHEGGRKRRKQTDERIASFRLSETQAYRQVMDDYKRIRRKAEFYLSTRGELTIIEVNMRGPGIKKIASIIVQGRGYIYDLEFTVVYGLTYDRFGEFTAKLIEVKRGRVTSLSDLVLQFLGREE